MLEGASALKGAIYSIGGMAMGFGLSNLVEQYDFQVLGEPSGTAY
jgi:hypothetical protein